MLLRLDGDRELRPARVRHAPGGVGQAPTGRRSWSQTSSCATLGPEAWPAPPGDLGERLAAAGARPLHSVLRDQQVIAGIGRTWVDEILHQAQLSPFKRGDDLDEEELQRA